MHSLLRKSLPIYLVFTTAFGPIAPAIAQASPEQQQNLPVLGSPTNTLQTNPSNKHASEWPLNTDTDADTDKDLGSSVLRNRTQGIEVAAAQGASVLSNAASDFTRGWFSSHDITSAVALKTDRKGVYGGSLDVLVPFYSASKSLAFVQAGARRAQTYTDDYRNTVNLGVGYRQDIGNWLLGANTFYDRDITGEHDRLGMGVEAWTDFLKLSANSYSPLSDWTASPDKSDYLERPAKGWDVRVEGYVPAYPQLGGRLAYEQYYGKEVSLFSADNSQKDPHAMSVGLIYNPVPLVSVGVDHRMGQGSLTDTSANLSFNYRIGEAFARQVSSEGLRASHLLANMRHDLVARNNEIVLARQQNEGQLRLSSLLTGVENQRVQFPVTGAANVRSITWVGSAAEFGLSYTGNGQASLTLPDYVSGAANSYSLQAVGTDKNGRVVESNVMIVAVSSSGLTLTTSHASIVADGSSTTTLTARIVDSQGQRSAAGEVVSWTTTAGTLASTTSLTDANGEATMLLTSPIGAGFAMVEARTRLVKRVTKVTFTAAAAALSVSASEAAIDADGTSTSTLSATVEDANGHAVSGATVNWSTTAGTLASATSTTNANGVASMVLTSATVAGTAHVQAAVGAVQGTTDVAFNALPATTAVVTASEADIGPGGDSSVLSATLTDITGRAVGAGVQVTWAVAGTDAQLADATSTTDANGVARTTLTSRRGRGSAAVTATAGAVSGQATVAVSAVMIVAATPVAPLAGQVFVTATITTATGRPVRGVQVNWVPAGNDLVVLAAVSTTDNNGVARTAAQAQPWAVAGPAGVFATPDIAGFGTVAADFIFVP